MKSKWSKRDVLSAPFGRPRLLEYLKKQIKYILSRFQELTYELQKNFMSLRIYSHAPLSL